MSLPFKDFGKTSKSLFEDGYNKDNFSYKVKSKHDKLEYEINGKTKGELFENAFKWTESFNGGEHFKIKLGGTIFSNGNLDFNKEVSTNDKTFGLNVKGSLCGSGSDKELIQEEEKEEKEFRDSIGVELKYIPTKTFQGSVDVLQKKKNPLRVLTSLSFTHKDFTVGSSFIFKNKKISKTNLGLLYVKDNSISIFTNLEDLKKLKVNFQHIVTSKLTAGIEFSHSKDSKENQNTITAAFQYTLNDKDNFLKGKVTSNTKDFSISYGATLCPNLNGILTVDSFFN